MGLVTKSDADKEWQEQNKKKYERTRKHIDRLKKEGKNKSAAIHEKRLQGYYDKHYKKLGADGYTVYSDDFKNVIQNSTRKSGPRESAFIIQGGNSKDPSLFERMSAKQIAKLKADGYDVNRLDVNDNTDYFSKDSKGKVITPQRNVANIIKNALANIVNLNTVSFYAHGGSDLNLTNLSNKGITGQEHGDVIGRAKSGTYNAYQLDVRGLTIGNPSSKGVHMDMFTCGGAPPVSKGFASNASVNAVRAAQPTHAVYVWPNDKANNTPGAPRAKAGADLWFSGDEGWITYSRGKKGGIVTGPAKAPYTEFNK